MSSAKRVVKPGDRFGKLVFVEKVKAGPNKSLEEWRVRCDCGNVGIKKAKDIVYKEFSTIVQCKECAKNLFRKIYADQSDKQRRLKKMREDRKRFYDSGQHLIKPKPVFE